MKGLYSDDHQRDDFIRYRRVFIQRMSMYEKGMIQYVGDFMETSISLALSNGDKTIFLVTHDESCLDKMTDKVIVE